MHQWKVGDLGQARPLGEVRRREPVFEGGSVVRFVGDDKHDDTGRIGRWRLVLGQYNNPEASYYCDADENWCYEYKAFIKPIKEIPDDKHHEQHQDAG